MMHFRSLGFAGLLFLGACANSTTFRNLADKTGLVVTTLESGTAEFIADQNRLNAANAARLDVFAAQAAAPSLLANRQTLAWTAAGDILRASAFETATQPSAADILASLNTRATRFPPVSAGAAADDYYKAAREALVVLSTRPSRGDGLAALLGFATEVRTNLDTLREEAAAAATAAATATATADTDTQTSAASD